MLTLGISQVGTSVPSDACLPRDPDDWYENTRKTKLLDRSIHSFENKRSGSRMKIGQYLILRVLRPRIRAPDRYRTMSKRGVGLLLQEWINLLNFASGVRWSIKLQAYYSTASGYRLDNACGLDLQELIVFFPGINLKFLLQAQRISRKVNTATGFCFAYHFGFLFATSFHWVLKLLCGGLWDM